MQNYRIQINEVDQNLYEDFKKGLKENDVQSTGHQSDLNEIKRIIFEEGLESFNNNPEKYLKKLRSRNNKKGE